MKHRPLLSLVPQEAPPKPGFFWELNDGLRGALVSMVRRELPKALAVGRSQQRSHDEEKLSRREEALQRRLNSVVEKYAEALELFDQWQAQGVRDDAQLDAALAPEGEPLSISAQLKELRRQIEMRTVGCGWREFETKGEWSFFADERAHTLDKLRRMLLEDILPHERALRRQKRLPKVAAPPNLKVVT